MKTVSRNKFMLCFRPVVDMDLVLDHPDSNHQLLYLGVDQKPSPADSPAPTSITRRQRRKTFSQAVKAVVFDTIQAKRVREKNACAVTSCDRASNSSRSKRNFGEGLRSPGGYVDKDEKRGADGEGFDSDSAPPSSCSSSFSTQELVLKVKTENGKKKNESKRKEEQRVWGLGLDLAAYLVLISLTLTVLWGRVCAILFTLISLYFLSRWQVVRAEDECKKRLVKTKSWSRDKSCRKKVIMEGLLDRTNRRGRGASIQFLT